MDYFLFKGRKAILKTETGVILGQGSNEDRDILLKVALFLNNKNIDIIQKIYQGKVEDDIIGNLLKEARYYRDRNNNNSLAWIEFICSLNNENRQILEDYIFNR